LGRERGEAALAGLRHAKDDLTNPSSCGKICLVNKINKTQEEDMQLPKGKKFYGSVTVSERGQIVIPAEARRDFGIEVGDKLLVFGDLEKGIGLVKASVLTGMIAELLEMFHSALEVDEEA